MPSLSRGDVHLVDLGMAQKVRPCLILSISRADSQRNMSVIAPFTTEIRGGECEIAFPKPAWLLNTSVINLIGLGAVDNAKIGRFLGRLSPATMQAVSQGLIRMLGL